jgi:ABC-2 type transport system permease protein
MANSKSNRVFTLLQREVQESKVALFWTPIVIAGVLTLIMLTSVLLANRVSIMGDAMMQVLMDEGSTSGMNITIHIDEEGQQEVQTYTIERSEGSAAEEDWNFSKEWTFEPNPKKETSKHLGEEDESLNPMLNMLHNFLILVLILVTINYLMNTLYQDRKDRSILFWKSMPVSEWEEVLCKFGIAMIIAPAIYIAVSMLVQLICVVLAMLMVSRMEMDPMQLIIGHVDFVSLFFNQVSGWILSAAWMAPFYAWILLASAAAKRSPFMLAFAPILALGVIEQVFLGSDYVATALAYHLPHYVEESNAVGFFLYGPDWSAISYPNLVGGLVFAGLALWGAVYLRRYRFEI